MRLLTLAVVSAVVLLGQTGILTTQEAAEGWIMLFDGETSFGWTAEGGAPWRIADGTVIAEGGGSGWMRTNSAFGDFLLKCDFRARAGGVSGLVLRSSFELPPAKRRFKRDQWNTYEVTAQGDHIVALLNGKKVLDTHDAKSRIGSISLRHQPGAAFRNIKLKPLGLQSIFDGKDLAGWRVVATPRAKAPAEWSVKDGAIHVEKGPGQLETEGAYKNFVLQLEVKTNALNEQHHPNSGVFFRGDPKGFWTGYESQIRNEYKDGDRTKPVDWGTGAIYNRVATRKVVSNDNEYFTKTIVAYGRHLAVWLNGYPVTDWEDPRPEGMNARKEARLKEGPISFQAHDPTTNLDFKNIRIVELP